MGIEQLGAMMKAGADGEEWVIKASFNIHLPDSPCLATECRVWGSLSPQVDTCVNICDLSHIPSFGGPSSLILCGSPGTHQPLHCTPKSRTEHITRLVPPQLCLLELLGTV